MKAKKGFKCFAFYQILLKLTPTQEVPVPDQINTDLKRVTAPAILWQTAFSGRGLYYWLTCFGEYQDFIFLVNMAISHSTKIVLSCLLVT